MKYYELTQLCDFLQDFKKIFMARRVDDSIIELGFDKDFTLFVDLTKSNSTCFITKDFMRQKDYNAPFDVLLYKNIARSEIVSIEVEEQNRIMRLKVRSNSKYKSTITTLQLEFTGKNTNAIILDENGVVLEALRHIDASTSFRKVSVGHELLPLPKAVLKETPKKLDIIEHLEQTFIKKQKIQLDVLKNAKLKSVTKKLASLQKELEGIPKKDELLKKAQVLSEQGSLVLANLDKIKPYAKEVRLSDYENKEQNIVFPKEAKSPTHGANMLFNASKKLKQKAKYAYKQKENLEQKIEFYQGLYNLINQAKTSHEIQILMPKKQQKNKKSKQEGYESFFYEGFKIMVGRNEKSNIKLLKIANKNDIWLHIKDTPSAHVIVRTSKQNLPQNVLLFAGKLCVNFSGVKKGSFLVDYTKYKFVRINDGANVFYTDFKTIRVDKE